MSQNNHAPWQQPTGPIGGNAFGSPQASTAFGGTPGPFSAQGPTGGNGGRGAGGILAIIAIVIGVIVVVGGVLFGTNAFSSFTSEESGGTTAILPSIPTTDDTADGSTASPFDPSTPTTDDTADGSGASSATPPSHPVPEGMTAVGNWAIAVTDVSMDANAAVEATSAYSQGYVTPLEDGQKYIGVHVTIANLASVTQNTYYDEAPGIRLYFSSDSWDYTIDEFFTEQDPGTVAGIGDLEPGATADGWHYLVVPSDFESGTIDFQDYETWTPVDSGGITIPLK